MSAATQLRAAIITRLKANSALQATAMGASPRIYNRAPPAQDPRSKFPFLVVTQTSRPWDTDSDRGAELEVSLHLFGEYEGDAEGEAIFQATLEALRDWPPAALSTHHLVNLVCRFSNVRSEEDGKRYYGLQTYRAVTEETA